jgi:hypothetical protein
MTRLVTGGCSCTDYVWHTWADYLGSAFDTYINAGQAGSDNANVARNVIARAKPGDLVVILWTGWNRQIKWNTNGSPVPKDAHNHWQYSYERWDKNWLVNFYDPNERLAASLDYIKMVDLDSKARNYQAYHFSAFPWKLGEIEKHPPSHYDLISSKYQIDNNFLEQVDLESFRFAHYNFFVSTKWNQSDRHPTPMCHYQYLIENMIDKLPNIPNLKITQHKVAEHQSAVLSGQAMDK